MREKGCLGQPVCWAHGILSACLLTKLCVISCEPMCVTMKDFWKCFPSLVSVVMQYDCLRKNFKLELQVFRDSWYDLKTSPPFCRTASWVSLSLHDVLHREGVNIIVVGLHFFNFHILHFFRSCKMPWFSVPPNFSRIMLKISILHNHEISLASALFTFSCSFK